MVDSRVDADRSGAEESDLGEGLRAVREGSVAIALSIEASRRLRGLRLLDRRSWCRLEAGARV